MNPASSIPPEGGQDWQVTYELWRCPLAPKSPTVWSHTPSGGGGGGGAVSVYMESLCRLTMTHATNSGG